MADLEPVETGQEQLARATITFHGEEFELADEIGLMPQMRFAKLAQQGADVASQGALVAMYDLIEQCFAPESWDRFVEVAIEHKSKAEELLGLVGQVFVVLADRPTQRQSDSSVGLSSTERSSTSSHVDRAIAQLAGRPDLQLIVLQAQEAMAS